MLYNIFIVNIYSQSLQWRLNDNRLCRGATSTIGRPGEIEGKLKY